MVASPGGSAAAALIPVKAFRHAKARLAPALDPAERAELARRLAEGVVAAAAPLPVWVVCDDAEVADWAQKLGAAVLRQPGPGLNAAVAAGAEALGKLGFARIVVAHADLPFAQRLAWTAEFPGVTLVPDRRDDGTNVLAVSPSVGFRFAYGPASFRRHAAEARRLGLGLRVVRDPHLGWDVDRPDDLPAGP
ncbi:MAG: 2-phospho-L-lactate guanylyltransferase [Acidimicrobiales bacterium]